ncbi:flagellar hook-length control protein FliK [Roseateles sp. BYS180W]|uniref:Flagellar hook-length control protein FliK n=1 Tax=Roseateles rivi TaxID=3299028 RepID=A0ABW7FV43_9BURK
MNTLFTRVNGGSTAGAGLPSGNGAASSAGDSGFSQLLQQAQPQSQPPNRTDPRGRWSGPEPFPPEGVKSHFNQPLPPPTPQAQPHAQTQTAQATKDNVATAEQEKVLTQRRLQQRQNAAPPRPANPAAHGQNKGTRSEQAESGLTTGANAELAELAEVAKRTCRKPPADTAAETAANAAAQANTSATPQQVTPELAQELRLRSAAQDGSEPMGEDTREITSALADSSEAPATSTAARGRHAAERRETANSNAAAGSSEPRDTPTQAHTAPGNAQRSEAPTALPEASTTASTTPSGNSSANSPAAGTSFEQYLTQQLQNAAPSNTSSNTTTAPSTQYTLQQPLHSEHFGGELAGRLSVMVQNGVEQAQLMLNPAEMGPVQVHIVVDGQQAQVNFVAEQFATREVLQASLPELAAALNAQGLTLSGGGVFEQGRQNQSPPQAPAQPARATPGDSPGGVRNEAPSAPAAPWRSTRGVLDLYV